MKHMRQGPSRVRIRVQTAGVTRNYQPYRDHDKNGAQGGAIGKPTLCGRCGKTVIPGWPEYREQMGRTYGTRWKESTAPIRARLCEGCMRRKASARGLDRPTKHRIENENKARRNRGEYELVGDWYDFQDEDEKLDLAPRLSED